MAYTPIVQQADLATHIYAEILEEITRSDNNLIERSITEAIATAKSYLSRYDLTALFGSQADGTSATYTDDYLIRIIKDLTCWYIIRLANPNLNREQYRQVYEDTIKTLEQIQKGIITPQGWPFYVPESTTPQPGNAISWKGNTKRNTHL